MYKPILILLLAGLMVSLGGCGGVSESDLQAVVSERDTLIEELTNIQEDVASLEKEYTALKKENNSLRNELEEQKREVTRLMARAAARPAVAGEQKSKETPRIYVVKSGDTLWSIASRFRVPVATLQKLNNLQGSSIKIGQQIFLP
ncbi:MAG: LysM peptidoglycan-binding domain-containing protein [Deltaproteobacteria bacterium]|nr:LysM peptidoglycan-binding domain-containing protein [Deltaproteobacteria bacterium]